MPSPARRIQGTDKLNCVVCFDLDDTLLNGVEEKFIPAYIEAISSYLTRLGGRNCKQNLLYATQMMLKKRVPQNTLEEEFFKYFIPGIGIPKQELHQFIGQFYQNEYPKLQECTSINHEAVALVKSLLISGHEVVIATNPIFPRTAILQRLEWAGLGDFINCFSQVTTIENYHFAKPNTEYYSEIIASLGWPEKYVVMVGNSFDMDIQPAAAIGIPSYWVREKTQKNGLANIVGTGGLSFVQAWLEQKVKTQNIEISLTLESIISHLKATPAAFAQFLVARNCLHISSNCQVQKSTSEIIEHMLEVEIDFHHKGYGIYLWDNDDNYPFLYSDSNQSNGTQDSASEKDTLSEFARLRTNFIHAIDHLTSQFSDRFVNQHNTASPNLLKRLKTILYHDQVHLREIKKRLETLKGKSN